MFLFSCFLHTVYSMHCQGKCIIFPLKFTDRQIRDHSTIVLLLRHKKVLFIFLKHAWLCNLTDAWFAACAGSCKSITNVSLEGKTSALDSSQWCVWRRWRHKGETGIVSDYNFDKREKSYPNIHKDKETHTKKSTSDRKFFNLPFWDEIRSSSLRMMMMKNSYTQGESESLI